MKNTNNELLFIKHNIYSPHESMNHWILGSFD